MRTVASEFLKEKKNFSSYLLGKISKCSTHSLYELGGGRKALPTLEAAIGGLL